jgi:hypothetical protein
MCTLVQIKLNVGNECIGNVLVADIPIWSGCFTTDYETDSWYGIASLKRVTRRARILVSSTSSVSIAKPNMSSPHVALIRDTSCVIQEEYLRTAKLHDTTVIDSPTYIELLPCGSNGMIAATMAYCK